MVLLINETKLVQGKDDKIDDLLNLSNLGYKYKVKSRPQLLNWRNHGGGVAFIYRDNLEVKSIKVPDNFKNLEAIVCEVSGTYIDTYTLCTYYNNPKSKLGINFLKWLATHNNAICMGDNF